MNLLKNVKVKSGFWDIIPWVSSYTASAIYPNIYIPKSVYKDLVSRNPKPANVALLIHEQTHIERQKKMGWIKWGFLYIFSPKFRFNEELAAIKKQMKYLKSRGLKFNLERKAKILSSWLYLWPVSYKEARRRLEIVWR